MKISGALMEALVDLLRGVGLLRDADQEVDFRKAVADLEKAKAQVWVEFVKATSPDPSRVYIWTNSLIALIRPAISTLIVGGMIFAPARILELVRTFGEAGPSGWIILSPVLWWFFGRDASKVLAMRYGGLLPVGSGAAERRFVLEQAFEHADTGTAWDPLEHLEEVDGQPETMDAIDPIPSEVRRREDD
jgi:hypothetical protein